jgi:hypothetical protein
MTSGLSVSSTIGLSTALCVLTQSLRGSNCAFIALIFSRKLVMMSGCSCSKEIVSLAVVDSNAGSAAEYVYDAEEMR